jgi:hypothetical protein
MTVGEPDMMPDTCCSACGEFENCKYACSRASRTSSGCEFEDCDECDRFVIYRSSEDVAMDKARKLIRENAM